jgi:hypothetical protein
LAVNAVEFTVPDVVEVDFDGDCPFFWQEDNRKPVAIIDNSKELILERFFMIYNFGV